jgi:hypothetical protein
MVIFVDGLVRSCMYRALDFECLIRITRNIDNPLVYNKKNAHNVTKKVVPISCYEDECEKRAEGTFVSVVSFCFDSVQTIPIGLCSCNNSSTFCNMLLFT